MKNKFIRLVTVCIVIVMALVCTGCPREPALVTQFTLQSLPHDATGLYASILAYNSHEDPIAAITLGKITGSQLVSSTEIPDATAFFFVGLSTQAAGEGTRKYLFYVDCSNGIRPQYIIRGYWEYWKNSSYSPLYAVNTDHLNLVDLTLGTPLELDFSRAPFYFFSFENARNQKFKITYDVSNAEIYWSTNLNRMLQQSSFPYDDTVCMISTSTSSYDTITVNGDILYVLIRAYNYEHSTSATITIENITNGSSGNGGNNDNGNSGNGGNNEPAQMPERAVAGKRIAECVSVSGTEALFTLTNDFIFSDVQKTLYLYDFQTGEISAVKECDDNILNLTRIDDGVLFSSGSDIYLYNTTTKESRKKKSLSNTVTMLCAYDDVLYAFTSAYTASANVTMLNLDDYTLIRSTQDLVCDGKSPVYIPELDKLFYINASGSPDDIYYTWWDASQSKFFDANSPYHGEHSMPVPLKRFGTDNYLVSGAGIVYSLEAGANFLTFDEDNNVGTTFIDIEFADDCFYTVTNYDDKCTVRKFSMEDRLEPEVEYSITGQKAADLILLDDMVQIVSSTINKVYTENNTDYYQISETSLSLDLENS